MGEVETGIILNNSQDNRDLLLYDNDKCDKYDYLAAVACGAVGGIVDIFLVGAPGDSVLGKWTDAQVDHAVISFAKLVEPSNGKIDNVASAIRVLEKDFKVNYDQRHTSDVEGLFSMSPQNHHMMSLAHSPDIVGLFFSILNQFTSTTSFIANGEIVTIDSDTFELNGSNFVSKVFCGVANWFGHIMSDIAGSGGSRKNGGRGSGVVIPFYELFQFCEVGDFSAGRDRKDFAAIAVSAFQNGYDLRFGLATAIPVIITDLSIRLIWALRRYFQYGMPLKECIPTSKHKDLRLMLLIGNGTLCVIDGLDAAIRSGGNFLVFFMRLNLVAWCRLIILVLKEICLRLGFSDRLQQMIEAFKRINEALQAYLNELEKIDIEQFRIETEKYNKMMQNLTTAQTDKELNILLLDMYDEYGIEKSWEGDFDEHMSNKNATLYFE